MIRGYIFRYTFFVEYLNSCYKLISVLALYSLGLSLCYTMSDNDITLAAYSSLLWVMVSSGLFCTDQLRGAFIIADGFLLQWQ
ncbi:hypothetical protein BDB00DRAFT_841354 [Zychaea mexicana]|uniref:uncharacterized protein n=1 Tax=Zychaea mexicana TaxID=64656 RepID=UPI0022FDEAB5|nr:uncharacterized protein BDB00DRAFT_841354 [Zychaea mexicana]KAI9489774.1 hypothetical protein BDB00DRAFT_841354 [Zychaea mexicana]